MAGKTNNIEIFLTDKVNTTPVRNILAGVCLFFDLFMISAAISLLAEGNIGSALIGFLLAVPLTVPVWRRVKHAVRKRQAQSLAESFLSVNTGSIERARFDQLLGSKNTGEKIGKLTASGYLRSVSYDAPTDTIIFTHRVKNVTEVVGTRRYKCPHCGGSGTLAPSAPARCEYCESAIESFINN